MTQTGKFSPPVPLAYKMRRPWRRRKWFGRIAIGVLLVTIVIALWYWRGRIERRGEILYWQHRCLVYTAPEDQIVGMSGSAEALDRLLKSDPAYIAGGYFNELSFVGRTSQAWEKYRVLVSGLPMSSVFSAGGGSPSPSPVIPAPAAVISRQGPTIAFMHERISPGGEKRLVVIALSEEVSKVTYWSFEASVYRANNFPKDAPGVEAGGLALVEFFTLDSGDATGMDVKSARFFAGQVDPHDPSRFTLRYELDDSPGIVDGQLLDHDQVRLIVRDGPGILPGRSWVFKARPVVIVY